MSNQMLTKLEKYSLWILPILLGAGVYGIMFISSNFEDEVFSPFIIIYFALKTLVIALIIRAFLTRQQTKSKEQILGVSSFIWAMIIFILLFVGFYIIVKQLLIIFTPQDDAIDMRHIVLSTGQSSLLALIIVSSQFLFIYTRKWSEGQVLAEKMAKETAQARMASLKLQLNPHFLFNNFNTLNSLIHEDADEASHFLLGLSELYRSILKHERDQIIPLSEEMKLVDQFNYIIAKRFGANYSCSVNLGNLDLDKCYIPPLSIQLLLENVIKHNIIDDENPLLCKIWTKENSILISNKIQLKNQLISDSGLGLDNLKSRYAILTDHKIQIIQDENFTVILPLLTLEKENTYIK